MEIHVICCNDSLQYAVVSDEDKALLKLDELRNEDYEKHARFYNTIDEYKIEHYWHLHTVNGE